MSEQVQRLREVEARNAIRLAKIETLIQEISNLVSAYEEDCIQYDRAGGDPRMTRIRFGGLLTRQLGDLGTIVSNRLGNVTNAGERSLGPAFDPSLSLLGVVSHELVVVENHIKAYEQENSRFATYGG